MKSKRIYVVVDEFISPFIWLESLGSVIGSSVGHVNSNCAVGSTIANWYDWIVDMYGVRKGISF